MTTPAVHSEDDNFIVGSGDSYDRLRRDARQLHLSNHNDTRSKAHFARFRNAALKCSMEATHKRVDQEKSLALREHERAQSLAMKRKQKYANSKVSYLPSITNKKSLQSNRKSIQTTSSNSIKKEAPLDKDQMLSRNSCTEDETTYRDKNGKLDLKKTNEKVSDRENSWMSTTSALDSNANKSGNSPRKGSRVSFELDRANSLMSGQIASSVDAINIVTLNEKKPKLKHKITSLRKASVDELASSHSSTASHADTLSTNSDVTLDLTNLNSPGKEQRTSGCSLNQSGQCLQRSSSSKSLRVYPASHLTVRRSNSCSSERHMQKEKRKDEIIWRDFDGLLKWFSDYLGKEHKPAYTVNPHLDEPVRDMHVHGKKKALLPKCSMSPLYFRFGVPENGVVRLC